MEKEIRFITSDYKELFRLPDGGNVQIEHADGEILIRPCKYVTDMLSSKNARTMLANSEFLILLNQAATDRMELAKLLGITDTHMGHVTNGPPGRGLIRCGAAIVPFENKFPTDTELYRLMSTRFNENLS